MVYKSQLSFHQLLNIANQHGDWISIHDNALWGGDYESISYARLRTDKPILAKGLHSTDDDIQRALDHGANHVLVVGRIPKEDLINTCLLEPLSYTQFIQMHAQHPNARYVINSRNLTSGEQLYLNMNDYTKTGAWICQASNIYNPSELKPDISAFLVGTYLDSYVRF